MYVSSVIGGIHPCDVFAAQEADRNAKELLEEEQREKEKADKKRLKKKRQKDRKRQQKLQEAQNDKTSLEPNVAIDRSEVTITGALADNNTTRKAEANNEDVAQQDSCASCSDEDLDLGSTFVRQAQKKMENKPKPERKERMKEPSRERVTERSKERAAERSQERVQEGGCTQLPALPQNNVNILDRFKIQESMDLANIGNNMASGERFSEALQYYTEAIKLNPSEYRFLGNRSYVFDRLGRYTEALTDAETALKIQPHFLKGHYRKGKALKGLQLYSEAIAAFQQVLLFDMNHVEAAAEIIQCRQKMQEVMTSTRVKVLHSAPLSPPAIPPTSAPGQNNKVFVTRNIYSTKNDPNKSPGITPTLEAMANIVTHSKLYPIWVGNITNKITENNLRAAFEPFGLIQSIRILYTRKCAFINFVHKDSAEAAFNSLQGLRIEGTKLILQLRNPEHSAGRAPEIGK
uniref:RRM domain-containing protein n=2 Tax=Pyxicephalus adspersus TaxID=30357 RepID=A0AAV3APZ0_PYXAD|nr:TPA: hypothetical protein GDO54_009784 [Pyxicephalus adspersus]